MYLVLCQIYLKGKSSGVLLRVKNLDRKESRFVFPLHFHYLDFKLSLLFKKKNQLCPPVSCIRSDHMVVFEFTNELSKKIVVFLLLATIVRKRLL